MSKKKCGNGLSSLSSKHNNFTVGRAHNEIFGQVQMWKLTGANAWVFAIIVEWMRKF